MYFLATFAGGGKKGIFHGKLRRNRPSGSAGDNTLTSSGNICPMLTAISDKRDREEVNEWPKRYDRRIKSSAGDLHLAA